MCRCSNGGLVVLFQFGFELLSSAGSLQSLGQGHNVPVFGNANWLSYVAEGVRGHNPFLDLHTMIPLLGLSSKCRRRSSIAERWKCPLWRLKALVAILLPASQVASGANRVRVPS